MVVGKGFVNTWGGLGTACFPASGSGIPGTGRTAFEISPKRIQGQRGHGLCCGQDVRGGAGPLGERMGICLSFRERGGGEESGQERKGHWLLTGKGKTPLGGIKKIPEQECLLPVLPEAPVNTEQSGGRARAISSR